jgi:carbon-monoxide dehydrogenase large subunit
MSASPQRAPQGRVEDVELLTGRGRYLPDLRMERMAAGVFVRSPHGAARIRSIDTTSARGAPGVVAVLTGADAELQKLGNISRPIPQTGRAGAPLIVPQRPVLARELVRHVGDPVALVVAETLAQATDAAELVVVDYEALPAVTDVREAVTPEAPQLWPEAPGNVALDFVAPAGNEPALARELDAIFAGAAHVARVSMVSQRVVVASLEPRGALADYDAAGDMTTLYVGSQGVTSLREHLSQMMAISRERLRVVTDDVGGGFGMKSSVYPEYVALLVAARQLRRPIRWVSTRSEAFLSDNQGRDTVTEMSLALDKEGRFQALRVDGLANMGAYHGALGAFIATANFTRCLPCVYDIPRIAVRMRCVFTNTVLVDEAARVSGIDRVALRRRNLIPPERIPYATPFGARFDSGDFGAVLDKALAVADAAGFPSRRAQTEAKGKRRGLGISCFLEHAGGQPSESAALRFPGDGTVVVALGAQSTGQGHRTVFRKLAAERLGIPVEHVTVRQGDTLLEVPGSGTVASRGAMTSGAAIARVVEDVIEKARGYAAEMLEAAASDLVYRAGRFEIVGTDRRVSLFDIATKQNLDTQAGVEVPQSFPNGCHIAEVEIDPETGAVELARYTAVDDCGAVLDHTIVEGQVHGGVAQGVGQALIEDAVYDRASGQLLTGSFMDYAMPRADTLPEIATATQSTICTTNVLGVKGAGEAGATGALAAVMNAIADAIPGAAGARLDMPATPLKVWQACRGSSESKKTGGH